MRASLLRILACPVCGKSLEFEGAISGDRMVEGVLHCAGGHFYQVKDEIPILKDPNLSAEEFVWTVEIPNLEEYEKLRKQYASYLSEELREADRTLINALAKTISNEKLVLDVASGMGSLLSVLSQQIREDASVLGIDVNEKPLRGAKLKLEDQKTYEKVSLCVMDGKRLAFKSETFPCVTSYFGFDNIPETEKAFEETYRVLTPRGRLAFTTVWLKDNSKSMTLAEKYNVGKTATENRLIKMLKKTGFKPDSMKIFYSGKWPHNPMDGLPVEGDWFAHVLVIAHKK